MRKQPGQTRHIGIDAQTVDDAKCMGRAKRVRADWLSLAQVGQVHFDKRQAYGLKAIGQGQRGMRPCAGIDQRPVKWFGDLAKKGLLGIALEKMKPT